MTTRPLTPTGLRCAHKVNPLGVAPDRVRLSWVLEGAGNWPRPACLPGADHGRRRLPWRGTAAGWSPRPPRTSPTRGPPLTAGGRYRWKVRVWDEAGQASGWSDPARFEVELDRTSGWHASWIGPSRIREAVTPPSGAGPVDPVARALTPAPYLRRAFTVDQPVTSARLYVTALGLYEARLNGRRVGDAVPRARLDRLRPAHRLPDLRRDRPAGRGRERPRRDPGRRVVRRLLRLRRQASRRPLRHRAGTAGPAGPAARRRQRAADRHRRAVAVLDGRDPARRPADGRAARPRARASRLGHARLRRTRLAPRVRGAGTRDADAAGRRPGTAGPGHPGDRAAQHRHRRPRPAHRRLRPEPDRLAADQHRRTAGTRVRIRHGEVLAADGSLYTDNLRTARQTDEFTTAGGPEVLEPRFTLHGFRYAEITGYPGDIDQADITARVVALRHARAAGAFESSLPWLDQLFRVIDWGQRGNFISVPTDCPQRDERLGWLGDAQIFARTACYNRDVAAFFAKWLDDVADAQLPSGAFTDVAPRLTLRGAGAPAWGDAGVIVPWTMWKMYGDTADPGPALRRHDQVDGLPRAGQPRLPAGPGTRQQLQRLARPGRRRHPARAARDRLLGARRRADGRDRRRDRPAGRRRRVPGAVRQDPVRVRGRVRGRRRARSPPAPRPPTSSACT